MKTLTSYEREVKNLCLRQKQELEALAQHQALLEIADEYAEMFTPNHEWNIKRRYSRTEYESLIFQRAELHLFLGKEDKADCVDSIINALIKDPRLDMTKTPEKILEDTTAIWEFRPKESSSHRPYLAVKVHYHRSEYCKLVGTGRYTEPTEIKILTCS